MHNLIEDTLGCYSGFASDLEIPPGHWPTQLPTTLGNGLALLLTQADENVAYYQQEFGTIRG